MFVQKHMVVDSVIHLRQIYGCCSVAPLTWINAGNKELQVLRARLTWFLTDILHSLADQREFSITPVREVYLRLVSYGFSFKGFVRLYA